MDPDGKRFVVRGVTLFDYLFSNSGSHPTGYADYWIGSDKNKNGYGDKLETYIDEVRNNNINLIRVAVEPKILKEFRGDNIETGELKQLDSIVQYASKLKIVVQIQVNNDSFDNLLKFNFIIASRYRNYPYVWINPDNEINCNKQTNGSNDPTANCKNALVWTDEMSKYIYRIRKAGFVNPIVLNGLEWSTDFKSLRGLVPNDSNIVLGAHIYANMSESFDSKNASDILDQWSFDEINHPFIIDEIGYINTAFGSEVKVQKFWLTDFLKFATKWTLYYGGSGVTGFNWHAYIPGLRVLDDNSMTDQNHNLTDWGKIYKSKYVEAVNRPYVFNKDKDQFLGFGSYLNSEPIKKQLVIRHESKIKLLEYEDSGILSEQALLDSSGLELNIKPNMYRTIGVGHFFERCASRQLRPDHLQLLLDGGGSFQVLVFENGRLFCPETVKVQNNDIYKMKNKLKSIGLIDNGILSDSILTQDTESNDIGLIIIKDGMASEKLLYQISGQKFSVDPMQYILMGGYLDPSTKEMNLTLFGGQTIQVIKFKENKYQSGSTLLNKNDSFFLVKSPEQIIGTGSYFDKNMNQMIINENGSLRILFFSQESIKYGLTLLNFI